MGNRAGKDIGEISISELTKLLKEDGATFSSKELQEAIDKLIEVRARAVIREKKEKKQREKEEAERREREKKEKEEARIRRRRWI